MSYLLSFSCLSKLAYLVESDANCASDDCKCVINWSSLDWHSIIWVFARSCFLKYATSDIYKSGKKIWLTSLIPNIHTA